MGKKMKSQWERCLQGIWGIGRTSFITRSKGIKVLIHLKDTAAEKHPLCPVCAGPSR